jgi:hypothetical protein
MPNLVERFANVAKDYSSNQSGFTPGDSAINQLLYITNEFGKALDDEKKVSDNTRVRIFFFFVAQSAKFFFRNSTLGYMTKTLNQIFFFLHQNQNIFFSKKKILNEAKNHNPPFKLNGRSLSSFREEDFSRNQPIRSKNCLWWSCLLTDQDEIGNLYRGPAIDALYKYCSFRSDPRSSLKIAHFVPIH